MGFKQYLTAALGLISSASAAQLTQVTNFGDNPSGALMYIYVPDNIQANPAVVVAMHYCSGTAQAYYQGTAWAQLSEQHNFIVIYPQSPYSGTCWDVSSDASLTHNGGGNSNAIANMVTYTLETYSADASRVFATGSSSGAMMTNVMAATYPELFQAASVYAGVPAGCFYTGTTNGWNSECSGGTFIQSQEEWAQTVRDMYPGYTGSYPRMLIYHGDADTTLSGNNYAETIKQWTGIFGYDTEPDQSLPNDPASPFTKEVYGEGVVGAIGAGVTHNIPNFAEQDLEWFGLV